MKRVTAVFGFLALFLTGLACADVPSIVTQPEDAIVGVWESGEFAAEAAGTEPLTFRWTFNATACLAGIKTMEYYY